MEVLRYLPFTGTSVSIIEAVEQGTEGNWTGCGVKTVEAAVGLCCDFMFVSTFGLSTIVTSPGEAVLKQVVQETSKTAVVSVGKVVVKKATVETTKKAVLVVAGSALVRGAMRSQTKEYESPYGIQFSQKQKHSLPPNAKEFSLFPDPWGHAKSSRGVTDADKTMDKKALGSFSSAVEMTSSWYSSAKFVGFVGMTTAAMTWYGLYRRGMYGLGPYRRYGLYRSRPSTVLEKLKVAYRGFNAQLVTETRTTQQAVEHQNQKIMTMSTSTHKPSTTTKKSEPLAPGSAGGGTGRPPDDNDPFWNKKSNHELELDENDETDAEILVERAGPITRCRFYKDDRLMWFQAHVRVKHLKPKGARKGKRGYTTKVANYFKTLFRNESKSQDQQEESDKNDQIAHVVAFIFDGPDNLLVNFTRMTSQANQEYKNLVENPIRFYLRAHEAQALEEKIQSEAGVHFLFVPDYTFSANHNSTDPHRATIFRVYHYFPLLDTSLACEIPNILTTIRISSEGITSEDMFKIRIKKAPDSPH